MHKKNGFVQKPKRKSDVQWYFLKKKKSFIMQWDVNLLFRGFFLFYFSKYRIYVYKDIFGETELTLSTEKFLNRNVLLRHMINEKILIYSNKSAIKEENS